MQDIYKAIHAVILTVLTSDIVLKCEAAWRLKPSVAYKITREADTDLDVRRLIELASGTKIFEAEQDKFEKLIDASEIPSGVTLQQMLYDAFRQNLVPPTLSAATFITLGIHPAWGLKLSHDKTNENVIEDINSKDKAGTLLDEKAFPSVTVEFLESVFDSFVSDMLSILKDAKVGSISDVEAEVKKSADEHYQRLVDCEHPTTVPLTLSSRIFSTSSYGDREYIKELIELWLQPCGAVLLDGDKFEVVHAEIMQ